MVPQLNMRTHLMMLWARGALPVLPQPQLQSAFGTVLAAGCELSVGHSLCLFLSRFYTYWAFQVCPLCMRYVFYVGIKIVFSCTNSYVGYIAHLKRTLF